LSPVNYYLHNYISDLDVCVNVLRNLKYN
jgi:hypothetical protein